MTIVMTMVSCKHPPFGKNEMNTQDGVTTGVRTIKASEFKAKCLKLMDEVAETGQEIIITKNGRPVSKLSPYRKPPDTFFGADKGKIKILGDIVSPMPAEWFEDPDDGSQDLF